MKTPDCKPKRPAALPEAHGSAALDRRVRLNMTAKREDEMAQLVNDLAENMNLRRWKRADLIECINWQQWLLCDAANDKADLRMKMLEVITSDMLPNDRTERQPPGCAHDGTKNV